MLAEPIRLDAGRHPAGARQRPGSAIGPRRGRDPAVRGVTDLESLGDCRRLARAGGRRSAPDRGVHRRPVRAGRVGPDVRPTSRPRDGRPIAEVAGGRCGRRRPGGGGGPCGVRRPALGGPVADGSQARAAPARRADPRQPRASSRCSSPSTSASRSATRCRSTCRAAATTIQWYAETIDKVYGEIGPTGPGRAVARDPRADRRGRRRSCPGTTR